MGLQFGTSAHYAGLLERSPEQAIPLLLSAEVPIGDLLFAGEKSRPATPAPGLSGRRPEDSTAMHQKVQNGNAPTRLPPGLSRRTARQRTRTASRQRPCPAAPWSLWSHSTASRQRPCLLVSLLKLAKSVPLVVDDDL